MTNNEAIQQLLVTEEKYGEKVYGPDSPAIGLARVGRDTQKIVAGTMKELMEQVDFGAPLHTLVIPAKMHDIEKAMWEFYHWNREGRREQIKKEAVEAEAKRVGEIEARAAEKKRKKHEWEAAQKRKKEEEKLSAAAAALKVADPESESESESDDGDDNGFSLA